MQADNRESTPPWHRVPVMWLVIALPLLAMLGGGIVVALTQLRPDPEVHSERLDAAPRADRT